MKAAIAVLVVIILITVVALRAPKSLQVVLALFGLGYAYTILSPSAETFTELDPVSKQFADELLDKYDYLMFDFDKTLIIKHSISIMRISGPSLTAAKRLKISNSAMFKYLSDECKRRNKKLIIVSFQPYASVIRAVLDENDITAQIVNGSELADGNNENKDTPRFYMKNEKEDMMKYLLSKYPNMSSVNAIFFDDTASNSTACQDDRCVFVNVSPEGSQGSFAPDKLSKYKH